MATGGFATGPMSGSKVMAGVPLIFVNRSRAFLMAWSMLKYL